MPGRSPYGERGLKFGIGFNVGDGLGRSPYGERGLKSFAEVFDKPSNGRSPYGERGLKSKIVQNFLIKCRRSPYGERGLKSFAHYAAYGIPQSLSLRRAWIEMTPIDLDDPEIKVALLTESVD